jgi:hypothetical protein
MENFKYYKSDFTPNEIAITWLFEYKDRQITREIGLDEIGQVILTLPDKEYPRGLFADSNISFDFNDLIEISQNEFETNWNNLK